MFQVNAQKTFTQVIDNPEIKTIIIDDDAIFKIEINTTNDTRLKLESRIEGEYAKDQMITTKTKHDTLIISSGFHPLYEAHNDKLSAHKVLSVEVSLWLPKQLNVYVKSAIASANINGNFKALTVELSQGNTTISNHNYLQEKTK